MEALYTRPPEKTRRMQMKTLIVRTLYLALANLCIILGNATEATAETKSQYGGFSADSLQVFYDYIHGQEMMKVKAGPQLRQAVEIIPINLGTAIDLKQEEGLRDWLYDFLVAFSASSNDSLAAAFYLRERIKNPALKSDIPDLFEKVKAAHRQTLISLDRDYFFENVSFFDSEFRVFEMQERYDSYQSDAKAHGMIPRGQTELTLPLRGEIEGRLQAGDQMVFADIMFIVEEPEEFTTFETPGRTPSFFRLVWDPERAVWRHVEAFFSIGVPQLFLFGM